jgi:hypothetical protein
MKSDTPITLAVAIYDDRESAVADYDFLRQVKSTGDLDHIAIAVLTKEADGHVQVERHDSTAKHLAWAGALTGGAMLVLAPAAAPIAMASSLGFGGGASAAGLAGAGGIAGHFWHNVPKERVAEMSDLLHEGESSLIVVAVNHRGSDVEHMLSRASKLVVDDTTQGDLEQAYNDAIARAVT